VFGREDARLDHALVAGHREARNAGVMAIGHRLDRGRRHGSPPGSAPWPRLYNGKEKGGTPASPQATTRMRTPQFERSSGSPPRANSASNASGPRWLPASRSSAAAPAPASAPSVPRLVAST